MSRVLPTEAEKMDFAANPIVSSMDRTDINSRKALYIALWCLFKFAFEIASSLGAVTGRNDAPFSEKRKIVKERGQVNG